ncbi:hypothetical protein B484DRAFT_472279, partial [Ochromonadaceae sp. CCMP2298]
MSKRAAAEAGSGDEGLGTKSKRERKVNSKYASADYDVRGVPKEPKPAKKKDLVPPSVSASSASGPLSQTSASSVLPSPASPASARPAVAGSRSSPRISGSPAATITPPLAAASLPQPGLDPIIEEEDEGSGGGSTSTRPAEEGGDDGDSVSGSGSEEESAVPSSIAANAYTLLHSVTSSITGGLWSASAVSSAPSASSAGARAPLGGAAGLGASLKANASKRSSAAASASSAAASASSAAASASSAANVPAPPASKAPGTSWFELTGDARGEDTGDFHVWDSMSARRDSMLDRGTLNKAPSPVLSSDSEDADSDDDALRRSSTPSPLDAPLGLIPRSRVREESGAGVGNDPSGVSSGLSAASCGSGPGLDGGQSQLSGPGADDLLASLPKAWTKPSKIVWDDQKTLWDNELEEMMRVCRADEKSRQVQSYRAKMLNRNLFTMIACQAYETVTKEGSQTMSEIQKACGMYLKHTFGNFLSVDYVVNNILPYMPLNSSGVRHWPDSFVDYMRTLLGDIEFGSDQVAINK